MAKKVHCDDCHITHGGFHLCLGKVELPPRGRTFNLTLQEKSQTIQERRKAEAAAKYADALEAYDLGEPIKSIVQRLGLNANNLKKRVTEHNRRKKENVA